MAVYLVTGGGGFIGSHLVAKLLQDGHTVKVIDNFSTGHIGNLTPYLNDIELHQEDIRNSDAVKSVVKGVDYILHQAALPSVARSITDPLQCHQVNTTGTLNLLIAAKESSVKRFVFASSSSVYGATIKLPKQETMPFSPLSPYASSKVSGELYCHNFHKLFGIPIIILRYFNAFGPRQDPNSDYAAAIPKFIKAILDNQSPVVYGDGGQSRDFTYIDNVVSANILAVQAPEEAVGHTFNIGCGQHTDLNRLLTILKQLVGNNPKTLYSATKPGDVRHSLADIKQAKNLLNYYPLINLEEGLRLTVESWKKTAV